MSTTEKVRENRLRRAAARQGLRLVRDRTRDPRAVRYGRWYLIPAGAPRRRGWQLARDEDGLTLDEVEHRLTGSP